MEKLDELFARHLESRLTDDEKTELMGLFLEPALQPQIKRLIEEAWMKTGKEFGMAEESKASFFQQLLASTTGPENTVVEMYPPKPLAWKKWIAAASIVILVGLGTYSWFFKKDRTRNEMAAKEVMDVPAPTGNRAVVKLADGKLVYLNATGDGHIAVQGNVKVAKAADGSITYTSVNEGEETPLMYNTLTNPRGSKVVSMVLSDGSHLWLNAGSSVTYPVVFAGNERKVGITGEAYFEVEHDPGRPFYVTRNELEVKVLGTHFNVNAYDEEDAIRVTLLEGLVQVKSLDAAVKIFPGQQAVATHHSHITINRSPDLEGVMAWKNGYFHFKDASLGEVMRQLARWYDVTVEYQTSSGGEKFRGELQRELSLAEVLKILNENNIRSKLENKKIIVLPQ